MRVSAFFGGLMEEKKNIMDESAMQRAITRITYEILERNRGADFGTANFQKNSRT